jgi:hypothetical protein
MQQPVRLQRVGLHLDVVERERDTDLVAHGGHP